MVHIFSRGWILVNRKIIIDRMGTADTENIYMPCKMSSHFEYCSGGYDYEHHRNVQQGEALRKK